jgi:hypothetical protein
LNERWNARKTSDNECCIEVDVGTRKRRKGKEEERGEG